MTSHVLAFLLYASAVGSALAQQATLDVDLTGIQLFAVVMGMAGLTVARLKVHHTHGVPLEVGVWPR